MEIGASAAAGDTGVATARSVRDATFEVMRRHGMTRIFGNPGSTEIPFLVDLPSDLEFVMALHEGSVVSIAIGYALARNEPAFVNLHTTPGLGNAVAAIANARDFHAPLVIVVGQQDRRQLSIEPFLAGRALEQLAGQYPVWASVPVRPQDVPGAIARAYHEAKAAGGPALVVVPMSDWEEPVDELAASSPAVVVRPTGVSVEQLDPLVQLLEAARRPAIVVGAGTDTPEGWRAAAALAERLRCPVWHEPFCGRSGFPQDHPQFAGHLHWRRRLMRETLAPHDLVLVLGTSAFHLYVLEEPEPPVRAGTRVAVITARGEEAHRSPAEVAVVGPVAEVCRALATRAAQRQGPPPERRRAPAALAPPGPDEPLRNAHVLDALAARLPRDAVVLEEAPSAKPELLERLPIVTPGGFLSPPNGALGFALSGAIGVRIGAPDRGVVAILGDGAAIFGIQGLWSAAEYDAGIVLIVLANGSYGVMDDQAAARGGRAPWPRFRGVDIAGIARALGCPATRVETHAQLLAVFDEELPALAERTQPILIEVMVSP